MLEDLLADLAFRAHAEQRAVRQHDRHAAGLRRHRGDHVLDPGVVAALAGGMPAKLRPHGSLAQTSSPHFSSENGGLAITQSNVARLSPAKNAGLAQRVAADDLEVLDAVQEQVHPGDARRW